MIYHEFRLSININLFPVQRPGENILLSDPAGNSFSFFKFSILSGNITFFGPDTNSLDLSLSVRCYMTPILSV